MAQYVLGGVAAGAALFTVYVAFGMAFDLLPPVQYALLMMLGFLANGGVAGLIIGINRT